MQLTTEAFFRKPSQIISRDILQEASLAMYYWATDNKPDLTHSSVMKKWSSRVQFFFQSMIRWFQNLLLLNYSYAFERSFASASLIKLDYTLAHTWLYSWKKPRVPIVKVKIESSIQSALCLTFWYGNKYWLVNKNYQFIDYSRNY